MADQTVIRFDRDDHPESGLQTWDPIDPETIVHGNPVQRGQVYFSTAGERLTAGVWDCTPYEELRAPYGVDEFMYFLEGGVTLTSSDGTVTTIEAGEGVTIPKEWTGIWDTEGYTKIWVIYSDDGSAFE